VQEGDEVRIHLKVVRNPRAEPEARSAAMEALLNLGTEGPRQLAAELATSIKDSRRRGAKARERFGADFEKGARRLLTARLDRDGKREVEELRTKILGLTRTRGLTKQMVLEESDPALERLRAILVVASDRVFAADDELMADHDALLEELASEALLLDYWQRAHDRLAASSDGEKIARRLKAPGALSLSEEELAREHERIARLTTSMSDGDRRVFDANRELAGEIAPSEAEGIEILNLLRVQLGLRALRLDPLLCLAGRDHCKDMVTLGFFGHDSPVPGKETPRKRAALAGTSGGAENVAMGQPTAARVIRAWWHSPGHQKNMLGSHGRVGLGRHEDHWTQMFGK